MLAQKIALETDQQSALMVEVRGQQVRRGISNFARRATLLPCQKADCQPAQEGAWEPREVADANCCPSKLRHDTSEFTSAFGGIADPDQTCYRLDLVANDPKQR
jgi:hypothetical protein